MNSVCLVLVGNSYTEEGAQFVSARRRNSRFRSIRTMANATLALLESRAPDPRRLA
jgi:hypothetical protein